MPMLEVFQIDQVTNIVLELGLENIVLRAMHICSRGVSQTCTHFSKSAGTIGVGV